MNVADVVYAENLQPLSCLLAKRNTEREESCARRTNLSADDFGDYCHLSPDLNRRRIHKRSRVCSRLDPRRL